MGMLKTMQSTRHRRCRSPFTSDVALQENFRSFEDAIVPFNKYACLVGPNGAGKSTVLTALNVFFRETENLPTDLSQLEQEDFHCKDTEALIRITVTFCDLSEEAQDGFSDYVRQGRLVVTAAATFDEASGAAQVKQYGQRLGMTALRPFFEALDGGKKVGELKEIYIELGCGSGVANVSY